MAYLGNSPARSFISFERQVFTIVNSQTVYTLDHSVTNENDIRLVVNNVVQEPGSGKAYTASGTTLTLSAALTNGTDEMYCVFLGRATATEAPGAGSVGTSQLASDAVTAAKLNDDIISGQTALGATPADTDEFLVSDAGTIKRVDYSYLKSANTPAFYAYLATSDQSVSQDTETKVAFNAELYDTDSAFDSTTNRRFTVPTGKGGKYLFISSMRFDGINYTGYARVRLYKNGSTLFATETRPYQTQSTGSPGDVIYKSSCILDLAAGDYVEMYVRSNATTSATLKSGTATSSYTWFSGHRLIGV